MSQTLLLVIAAVTLLRAAQLVTGPRQLRRQRVLDRLALDRHRYE